MLHEKSSPHHHDATTKMNEGLKDERFELFRERDEKEEREKSFQKRDPKILKFC